MSDTKALLQKIAALRQRLSAARPNGGDGIPVATEIILRTDPAQALEAKVQEGTWHNAIIDTALRPHDPAVTRPDLPPRFTARGARLLQRGRDLLHALRALADEPVLQADERGPFGKLHAETAAMIDSVLRAVLAFPPASAAQLRLCEGLEAIVTAVEERIGTLRAGLAPRRLERERLDYLAQILSRLAANQPVGLPPLQALGEALVQEAQAGEPLRFVHVPADDPARFAAAHGLTVAQVLLRLLLGDPDWQTQLHVAAMAALVHDVGMVRVPSEVIGKTGPLTDDERRLIEKHAAAGGDMVRQLWPGGGWTVEAVTDHHERPDGTGYPFGRKEIELAPFVRLLAVCDVYAALASPRPHRPALEPRTALTETLLLAESGALDPVQAERLLLLSFYPPGSVVELNDGTLALVTAAHAGAHGLANPARPIVSLLSDAAGQPFAFPRVVDLAAERERSIVRSLTAVERQRALGRKYPALA